jgi:hypothetical protein
MIIVYEGTKNTKADSWDHAHKLFLDAVKRDADVSVWDADPDTHSAVQLWSFDGAARQAAMRPFVDEVRGE